jgi:hypothetical protein
LIGVGTLQLAMRNGECYIETKRMLCCQSLVPVLYKPVSLFDHLVER